MLVTFARNRIILLISIIHSAKNIAEVLLDLIKRLDVILGTNNNFELGIWTRGALEKAKMAMDDEHSLEYMEKVFLFASKNQVSLWGPNGEINDYSAREWNGLVGDYHYGRWELYFNMMFDFLDRNETINMDKYHEKAVEFGREWNKKPDLYSIDHFNPTNIITKHHNTLFVNALNKFTTVEGKSINEKKGYLQSKTVDPMILSVMCEADPDCYAYDNKGMLFRKDALIEDPESTLYIKA